MKKLIHSRLRTSISAGFVLILAGLNSQANSQDVKKIGTSSAAFLGIPVGAKGIAMGSAFVAIADEGAAMFWNPGNLANQAKRSLFAHHSPWLPGLGFYYLGFSLPVENVGVFGLNVASLQSNEMDITTPAAPMGTGETFTAASAAVGIAYARRLTDRFSLGANFKYINERILHSTATGFAFDVGTMFITPFRSVRLGVSVSNMGTRMQMGGEDLNAYVDVAPGQEGNNDNIVAQLKTDQFDLPILMRIGLAWDLRLSQGSRVTFACDGVNPNDNAQSLNFGIEFAALRETLVLRGGMSELFLEDSEGGLTLGAGLKIPQVNGVQLALGYAYQDFQYLGGINHVSIEIMF